ncbi:MAG: formylglycine-generating enzyme family protein [Thermoguttaceae bacterium]
MTRPSSYGTWTRVSRSLPATQSKEAGDKTKSPPKEVSVDLGKGLKLEMVLIPAGEFLMGSPDTDNDAFFTEKPQHRVRITKPFYLGKYLVTREQWEAVMHRNNSSNGSGPKDAVDMVSWDYCQEFLDNLNKRQDNPVGKLQLPTEAQWEYACRAGSKTRFCFGDEASGLGDYAWYYNNSGQKAHPVGEKKPNAWGLYDMHGSVFEWCQDWYGNYKKEAVTDPSGPAAGSGRVSRTGTWYSQARDCRSGQRCQGDPGHVGGGLGFRVALTPMDK